VEIPTSHLTKKLTEKALQRLYTDVTCLQSAVSTIHISPFLPQHDPLPPLAHQGYFIVTASQNHRMLGVGRDLWGSFRPTPLPKQGHLQQAAQDHVTGGVLTSPEKETPQPPWAACSSAPSPSEGRNSSSCSDRTSYASVCAHCPLSHCWAPMKRVWPHPLDIRP